MEEKYLCMCVYEARSFILHELRCRQVLSGQSQCMHRLRGGDVECGRGRDERGDVCGVCRGDVECDSRRKHL
jgi:hypothetical protein